MHKNVLLLVVLGLVNSTLYHSPILAKGQSDENKELSVLSDLKENAEFKLIGRALTYYDKIENRPGLDENTLVADGRLEVKTGFFRGDHQFGISGWFEYGSQEDTYSQKEYYLGVDRAESETERMRRYLELNELYWIASRGDFDITLGKKLFTMGVAPLYSPVDHISPLDFNDPLDAKKYGLWQVTIDYYKDASTFSFSLFPFFIPPKIPSMKSRWISSIATGGTAIFKDFQFFNRQVDVSRGINEDLPDGLDEFQILARINTIFKGWDFFVSGFNGISTSPVMRPGDSAKAETDLVRQYIRATRASFGFSTTFSKLEFHGEGLFQLSQDSKDDDYVAYISGFTYIIDDLVQGIGLDKVELILDYAREEIINRQNRTRYLQSSEIVRIGQSDLFALASIHISTDFIIQFVANFNLDDDGRVFMPGFRYQPWESFWLKVNSHFFHGPDDSFYGRWEETNRLVVSFDFSF